MLLAFLTELGYGFLRLLANPVFYMAVVFSLVLAFRRIQKERFHFHIRVYDAVSDLYHTFIPGLLAGIILYGLFIGLGFMLNKGVIMVLMAVAFLLCLTFQPRLLSPSLVIFLTAAAVVFLPDWETNFAWLNAWRSDIEAAALPNLFMLMAILTVAEAFFIMMQAKRQPSPRRIMSERGKPIGGFEVKRVWLVPAFLFIPGFGLERLGAWPFFAWEDSFSFMLVPFLIGYEQLQTFDLPKRAVLRDGLRVAMLGFLSLPLAILTSVNEWLIAAFLGMAALCFSRYVLYAIVHKENEEKPAFFTLRNQGLQILAVVPKSPAAEMNVNAGEIIARVNEIPVNSSQQFYEALQANPTFVKLEVIDERGEVRFEQRALYENEHHELGLLFVDDSRIQYQSAEEA